MTVTGFLILFMFIASAACMMGLGIYCRRFSSNPASVPYQLLMFCAAFWSLLYALDLVTNALPMKVFWQETRFIFIPFMPVLELWLVLTFLKRDLWISGWKLYGLFIIPVFTVIIALTSQYHTLFRYTYEIIESGMFTTLKFSTGPFFVIYSVYSYTIMVLAFVLLLVIHGESHKFYTRQRILLSIALFTPVLITFTADIGITPVQGVNFSPAFLWVTGILYAIALFRYNLFDIIPVARSKVIDEMGMPMMVLNNEGRVIDFNPAASQILEYPGKKPIGKTLSDLIPDCHELIRFCSSKEDGREEITWNKGVTDVTYEARIDTIFSDSGTPEARVILLTDITRQKNLEQNIRDSENRWKSIVDGAPFPIIISRVLDNMILLVNKRTVEEFKIPESELIGSTTERFYADLEKRTGIINSLREKGLIDDIMLEMKSQDGRSLWVYASVRKIKYLNDDAYFISFADITRRKLLEDTLRKKNTDLEMITHTLQETHKKLNILSSITRHDILNKIQVILLVVDLLKEPASKEKSLKNIGVVFESAQDIQGLIEFTAEYQELGQAQPQWQEITSIIKNPVIQRLLSGISLQVPSSPVEIFADHLLQKVFYNLVENSIRHGGTIHQIEISIEPSGKDLLLIYEDDGVGVPPDDKSKIFERGYGKHTGLGLFLIQEILDITGMKIIENGIPGKGVRFEIFIPEGKFRITG